jgi:predicted Zn-dependent protease
VRAGVTASGHAGSEAAGDFRIITGEQDGGFTGFHWLLLFCITGLLTACATSPTDRSQLMLMPDDQMAQMGLQAFEQIKGKTPVSASPVTNRYVQCVAANVTREIGGHWEVVVFEDDSANTFALPGGKIGVNTGLFKVASNRDPLATVIGHEVAQVKARHSNERVSQKFAVQQGIALTNAVASPSGATG